MNREQMIKALVEDFKGLFENPGFLDSFVEEVLIEGRVGYSQMTGAQLADLCEDAGIDFEGNSDEL